MEIEDAIRILDQETTEEALAEIEYYGGFCGRQAKIMACDEACEIAVAAMKEKTKESMRPHGRWEVVVGSDGKERMVCTVCRKQQDLTGVFSYCQNCGAKMDKETGS